MISDATLFLITSIVVALIAAVGVVLSSQRSYQSASLDTIVKQYQTISVENANLKLENIKVCAERDALKAQLEGCEKRLPPQARRRQGRGDDSPTGPVRKGI